MGLFSRKSEPDTAPRPRAVVAAAMPLEGPAGKQAWNASSSDTAWQERAWYYYDAVGELRFAFNWLANALSRAVLFAAETDPETGQTTGPTEDPRAQAAARQVLGGPEHIPRLLTLVALHWQATGETYVLVLPQAGSRPDRWEAVARTSLRQQGGTWSFKDPVTGAWTRLRAGTDRVIRVWSPHPSEQTNADCAMRAAIPICAEIEKSSQNIAARLDSRLAGNGIFFLPQEIDFPVGEGEQANAQSFMRLLLEAGRANLENPGTAESQVPIMAQVPSEFIAAIAEGHVDLSTAMDAAIPELREGAFTRLGRTLEMSAEIAMSKVADANHWTAWQIEESTYKVHLEPFLLKLGMALTTEYYRGVLSAMGVPDPERFVLNWNVQEVVSRPDDKEDLKYLWENLLISNDFLRSEFGIPDDAIPDDDEVFLRRLAAAVNVAPTLAAQREIAEKLFGLEVSPAAAGVSGPLEQPALEPGTQPEAATAPSARGLPTAQEEAPEPDAGLVAAAELVVFDALSRAGGRLLTPAYRGQFKAVQRHDLHTQIPVNGREDQLMEGSFQFTDRVAHAFSRDPDLLRRQLQAYVRNRLVNGWSHDQAAMTKYMSGP